MRIERLKLENYRKFSKLEGCFHPELTVLVARNGQGKSSILEAVIAAFGTFTGAFDMGKSEHISQTDVRLSRLSEMPESEPQYPVVVTAKSDISEAEWFRELTGPKNKTTIKDASPISDFGKLLQDRLREDQNLDLPLLAYYGTGRLWKAHKNMLRKSVLKESRTMGYEDCLSPASNFTQMQQWMSKATLAILQQQQTSGYEGSNLAVRVKGIQTAVNAVLETEGWSNFHYSLTYEELAMSHSEHGILPVSMLSDGVRAMISLVADIAFRCVRLNGHFGQGAPSKTKGIVLIDEVDLHLHPQWQQKILLQLRLAFPQLQLIVTTHSPQVLSTVKKECIRVILPDRLEIPLASSYGEESQNLLQEIMCVDPQPPIPERQKIDKLTTLVEGGDYTTQEAKDLFLSLEEALTKEHSQLQRLKRSIRRQQVLDR